MGLGLRLQRRRIGCCPARCQLACVYGALDGASPTTTGTLYTGCRRGPISERWVRLSSVRRSRRVGAVTFAWAGVSYQALGTRSFALCPLCFAATRSWRRRRCVRDTVSVQPRLGLIRPLRPFTSRSTSTLRAAIGHVTSPRAAMHSKSSCHSTPSDNQPRMHLSITPSSPSHGRTSHLPRQGFPSPHLSLPQIADPILVAISRLGLPIPATALARASRRMRPNSGSRCQPYSGTGWV
jgi:hypothetical protein